MQLYRLLPTLVFVFAVVAPFASASGAGPGPLDAHASPSIEWSLDGRTLCLSARGLPQNEHVTVVVRDKETAGAETFGPFDTGVAGAIELVEIALRRDLQTGSAQVELVDESGRLLALGLDDDDDNTLAIVAVIAIVAIAAFAFQ